VSRNPLPVTPAVPIVELGNVPEVPVGVADGGVVMGGGVVGGVLGGGVAVVGGVVGVILVAAGSVGLDVPGSAADATVGLARMKPGVIVVVVPAGPVATPPPCTQPVTVTICEPGDVLCGVGVWAAAVAAAAANAAANANR